MLTVLPADANEFTSSRMQQEYTVEKYPFHSTEPTKSHPVPDPMLGAKSLIVVAPSPFPRGAYILRIRDRCKGEQMHSFVRQI